MDLLRRIEEKWQKEWEREKIFDADPDPTRKKCFVTFPYSYANGPLHVGHAFTATRVDAYARYKRMRGYNVLFPWAWHWTGQTVAGASERVKRRDKEFIRVLREVDGVSEKDLRRFVDPVYMASYYTNENRETVKRAGLSVDLRREFNTTDPTFSRFIEWQYERLRERGYVVKGTHPVVWCPHCQSPTGDADRQEGEGVSPEEYTLIKFKIDNAYLPAATFRPETIYGVTNMWIRPDADYVRAHVDNEEWLVSAIAAKKLKEQTRKVRVIEKFKGREIIGKSFVNPINGEKLPVLPGWFVNPEHATGVVYSVPAHAPYDWLALRDLRKDSRSLKEFNIDPTTVKSIKPISMIRVEGFGEYPAIEIAEQLGAKDQYDPKAEEATKLLYKKEFHSGVLREICGEYAGKTVYEVKDQLIENFKEKGIADSMYDLPQSVICRCLTPCIVKVLEGQWFLKYSDEAWKESTKQALRQASIYPESAIKWFIDIIDWLREWACARKSGLGTPLPWSPDWVVETLSDSTVYMAFYTINKHIKQYDITPEQLGPDVFDYVFHGKGDVREVAETFRINFKILESMRTEFQYWYPVDFRNSAKELVPNHLTFFLFHHVALFPEYLPKAVGVNGMLMIEGDKMSKSKGNFVTLKSAIEQYGVDATRCGLLLAAEGMDDPDWRSENLRDVRIKLQAFYTLADNIIETAQDATAGLLEQWLISTLQHRIKAVTESIEVMKTRTAAENALFEIWNDIRWYTRRKGTAESKILKEALDIWTRLLAPFTPHLCEEVWSRMGKECFLSQARWPMYDERRINIQAEEAEALIKNVLDDTSNILRAIKIVPKKIYYYTAAPWKWRVYLESLEKSVAAKLSYSDQMQELMKAQGLKKIAGEVAEFLRRIVDEINRMPQNQKRRQLQIKTLDEHRILKEAESFFEREFNAKVTAYQQEDSERYDPRKKGGLATPYRPAIYVE